MKSRHGFIGGYREKEKFEEDIVDQLGYEYYDEICVCVDDPFEDERREVEALIEKEEEEIIWVE